MRAPSGATACLSRGLAVFVKTAVRRRRQAALRFKQKMMPFLIPTIRIWVFWLKAFLFFITRYAKAAFLSTRRFVCSAFAFGPEGQFNLAENHSWEFCKKCLLVTLRHEVC